MGKIGLERKLAIEGHLGESRRGEDFDERKLRYLKEKETKHEFENESNT
jgi:hypothetical protein